MNESLALNMPNLRILIWCQPFNGENPNFHHTHNIKTKDISNLCLEI